ncbi:MAG: hypothetical protein MK180_18660 [Rhodobacteraceae bacterium]|nr:hypothetical protein [Paracoccaceae bacterium]
MEQHELDEQLWAIAERFFPRPPVRTLLGGQPRPFDIDCPVLHESKAAFEAELAEVEKLKAACQCFKSFLGRYIRDENEADQTLAQNVAEALNKHARKRVTREPFDHVISALQGLASQQGQTPVTLLIVMDFEEAIDDRLQDLETQRKDYWSLPRRAPNHFARIIALRFAKAIARNTGKKPTIGTSRDGSHPSTEFGRALDEVFKLLEINADFRRAGEWAVKQLTDADLLPMRNAFAGLGSYPSGQGANVPAGLAEAIARTDKKLE